MISKEAIFSYRGPALRRGRDYAYIAPHALLRPFIANYTLTCPSSPFAVMPDDYTILPTASATLCYRIDANGIEGGLRGVNTQATIVGAHANRSEYLLLIEFHPAGLYPLTGIPQSDMLDDSFDFSMVNKDLHRQICELILTNEEIETLIEGLDRLFLTSLSDGRMRPEIGGALARVVQSGGGISSRTLAAETFVSERQLERLFKRHIGTGIKTFSRIVRLNRALHLIDAKDDTLTAVAMGRAILINPILFAIFRSCAAPRHRRI